MWYAVIGIAAFFFGCLFGFLTTCFFFVGGRQDEERAVSVRLADAKEDIREAKKRFFSPREAYIKDFEEEYQASFSEFERSLAQSGDERLSDYAEWTYWERTLANAQEEANFQQSLLRE